MNSTGDLIAIDNVSVLTSEHLTLIIDELEAHCDFMINQKSLVLLGQQFPTLAEYIHTNLVLRRNILIFNELSKIPQQQQQKQKQQQQNIHKTTTLPTSISIPVPTTSTTTTTATTTTSTKADTTSNTTSSRINATQASTGSTASLNNITSNIPKTPIKSILKSPTLPTTQINNNENKIGYPTTPRKICVSGTSTTGSTINDNSMIDISSSEDEDNYEPKKSFSQPSPSLSSTFPPSSSSSSTSLQKTLTSHLLTPTKSALSSIPNQINNNNNNNNINTITSPSKGIKPPALPTQQKTFKTQSPPTTPQKSIITAPTTPQNNNNNNNNNKDANQVLPNPILPALRNTNTFPPIQNLVPIAYENYQTPIKLKWKPTPQALDIDRMDRGYESGSTLQILYEQPICFSTLTQRFAVLGSSGSNYVVDIGDRFICSCPDYAKTRGGNGYCKHIAFVFYHLGLPRQGCTFIFQKGSTIKERFLLFLADDKTELIQTDARLYDDIDLSVFDNTLFDIPENEDRESIREKLEYLNLYTRQQRLKEQATVRHSKVSAISKERRQKERADQEQQRLNLLRQNQPPMHLVATPDHLRINNNNNNSNNHTVNNNNNNPPLNNNNNNNNNSNHHVNNSYNHIVNNNNRQQLSNSQPSIPSNNYNHTPLPLSQSPKKRALSEGEESFQKKAKHHEVINLDDD